MHLGNTTTNRVEYAHWALKRVLQNSLGDYVVYLIQEASWNGFKIAAEFERVHYAGKNPSCYGCVMRTTQGLCCACELSKYVLGSILLDSIHKFWRRLGFLDQRLSEP
ncbi:hypothetical protein GmHk_15G044261 [Glycine max]|nr:hypothetical protein GmHk_15G044261 [Glycine max]KAH1209848.1 hypothetical protein GmHk_15G044261 [Glycine max]